MTEGWKLQIESLLLLLCCSWQIPVTDWSSVGYHLLLRPIVSFLFFLTLFLLFCLHRGGRRRMFVTSTLYPVVTVTLTSVQWQWIKVTLTSYTLTDLCIRTHAHTHTHNNASTSVNTHTCIHLYIHPPPLYLSLWLACPGSLSSSLTNELEAASPSSSEMVFVLTAHVGQQGQTTVQSLASFSLNPHLNHWLFFCISMENNQECEPVQVPDPPDTLKPFIHPSVWPSSLPIMYPNRQTDVLALLQFWKWHGGLSR